MAVISVLLVDDEVAFLEAMARRLRRRHLEITCASSGQEALEQLEQTHVEVVLLDIRMPGMDGIETLKEMKKRQPLVEVIILTGQADVKSAIEGMKLGAFDYLTKPCDVEPLVSHIKEAAASKRRREKTILEARMKPYVSQRDRDECISRIKEKAARGNGGGSSVKAVKD